MPNAPSKIILRRAPRGGLAAPEKAYRGGQFITDSVWQAEKRKAEQDLPGLIDQFGADFQFLRRVYEQQVGLSNLPLDGLGTVEVIPLSTVEARLKARIRDVYTRAFTLGKRRAGNLTTVNAEDALAIRGTRLDEFTYLKGFLRDMADGAGVMPYSARADYYAKAARELYWLGFVLGDQSAARRIKWVLGETEHCRTCLTMANASPIPVVTMAGKAKDGILPNSGRLDCKGYKCGCHLEDDFNG